MQVMIIIKGNEESEAGALPDEKFFAEMAQYNHELVKAGVMIAGHGLLPSSKGKRVKFSDGKVTVIDGPFIETKELIAGFWLWQVNSLDEAVEWVKRCPAPEGETEGEIEIRQVFEGDCAAEDTPERAAEQRENLIAQLASE